MNDDKLAQFVDGWYNNPVGLCHLAGWAIGAMAIEHINEFTEACGAAFFGNKKTTDRIDYLYENAETKDLREPMVALSMQEGVVCVHDLTGHHNNMRLMLLRGMGDGMLVYYSVRQYIQPGETPGLFLSGLRLPGSKKPTFSNIFGQSQLVTDPSFFSVSNKLAYLHVFDEDYSFWNFRPPENPRKGVIIHPRSEGFFDLPETLSVGRLIILASNLLGFRG